MAALDHKAVSLFVSSHELRAITRSHQNALVCRRILQPPFLMEAGLTQSSSFECQGTSAEATLPLLHPIAPCCSLSAEGHQGTPVEVALFAGIETDDSYRIKCHRALCVLKLKGESDEVAPLPPYVNHRGMVPDASTSFGVSHVDT